MKKKYSSQDVGFALEGLQSKIEELQNENKDLVNQLHQANNKVIFAVGLMEKNDKDAKETIFHARQAVLTEGGQVEELRNELELCRTMRGGFENETNMWSRNLLKVREVLESVNGKEDVETHIMASYVVNELLKTRSDLRAVQAQRDKAITDLQTRDEQWEMARDSKDQIKQERDMIQAELDKAYSIIEEYKRDSMVDCRHRRVVGDKLKEVIRERDRLLKCIEAQKPHNIEIIMQRDEARRERDAFKEELDLWKAIKEDRERMHKASSDALIATREELKRAFLVVSDDTFTCVAAKEVVDELLTARKKIEEYAEEDDALGI